MLLTKTNTGEAALTPHMETSEAWQNAASPKVDPGNFLDQYPIGIEKEDFLNLIDKKLSSYAQGNPYLKLSKILLDTQEVTVGAQFANLCVKPIGIQRTFCVVSVEKNSGLTIVALRTLTPDESLNLIIDQIKRGEFVPSLAIVRRANRPMLLRFSSSIDHQGGGKKIICNPMKLGDIKTGVTKKFLANLM